MPAVTVLLPIQGDGAAVAVAARSLFGQEFADFELLLIEGQDRAAELDELADEDGRVRVVRSDEAGLGMALNHGLQEAQGELIVRVSAADRSASERLGRQVGLLSRAPEVAFVGTGWQAVAADGSVGRVVQPPAGDAALRAAMATGDAIGRPTAMMRREAVIKAGGWRPAFVDFEDYDLLLRLLDRHAGVCAPEALVECPTTENVVGWRVLEQRILSEMGAVAAHDRRQAGRPDHGERMSPLDRSVLYRMGLVEEEITRGVLTRAMTSATAAGAAGQWREMREAARLGLEQEGLPSRAKAQLIGLWLRSVARRRPISTAVSGHGEPTSPPGLGPTAGQR